MWLVCLLSLSSQAMKVEVSPSHNVYQPQGEDKLYIEIALDARDIQMQEAERPKLNLSLVLDRSGSMRGEPIEYAKQAAMDVYSKSDSDDILSLVTYSSSANILLSPQKNKNIEQAINKIKTIQASGNTALYAGVEKGAEQVQGFYDTALVNRVILLSDGLANEGPSSIEDLTFLSGRLAKQGISVSTVGLGLEYDEQMMMKIAQKGDGNHYYVQESMDLQKIFSEELALASKVYAQDLRIKIIMPEDVKIKGFLNYEGQIIDNQALLSLGQIMAGVNRKIYLEIDQVKNVSENNELPVKLELQWHESGQPEAKTLEVATKFAVTKDPAKVQKNEEIFQQAHVQKQYAQIELAGQLLKEGDYSEAEAQLDGVASYIASSPDDFEGKEELLLLNNEYQEILSENVEVDASGNATIKDESKVKSVIKRIYQDSYKGKKNEKP